MVVVVWAVWLVVVNSVVVGVVGHWCGGSAGGGDNGDQFRQRTLTNIM
jgi:hypothetical protein